MRLRRALLVLCSCAALCAPGAEAATPSILDKAARHLAVDPVYVDPAAEQQLSTAQQRQIRAEIVSSRSGPVYVAVLPSRAENEAGGDPTAAVRALAQKLDRQGTYVAVIGPHLRALSDVLREGQAGSLATDALNAHGDEGIGPTLVDFVDRVAAVRNGPGEGSGRNWIPFAVVAALFGLFVWRRRRNRARRETAQLEQVRGVAHEDLIALADDVQQLETRVERSPGARAAYERAVAAYGRASEAFDRARSPQQLAAVAESLDEGRYEMAVAEAELDGRHAPERRPPCFFDPRHGPSTREVEWAPPGGAPRAVPACEADAQRVEQGLEPQSRQVPVGGGLMPYWAAPPMYGGYFGGFLPGLLLGEMMFGGWGWGGPMGYGGYDMGGGGLDSGGGGFDSGDFGGGLGGGDLGGGGDFGGGGGGGGDF
jgi:hypothetical protein